MIDILKENKKVLERPSPQVLFLGFGDSSLDFELRAFISNFDDRFPVIDSLHNDINKALEAAGISIPFPQRDLHIVSDSYPPSKPLKNKPVKTSPPKKSLIVFA